MDKLAKTILLLTALAFFLILLITARESENNTIPVTGGDAAEFTELVPSQVPLVFYSTLQPTTEPAATEKPEHQHTEATTPKTEQMEIIQEPVEKPEEKDPLADYDVSAEIEAMALTLAGECYDDKVQDKRLVCEVILNRVSNGGFGDSVIEVVTAPCQFNGYWHQSREVTESDYAVAEQALRDWYANGCKALSDYLYFSAGANRENVFRKEF